MKSTLKRIMNIDMKRIQNADLNNNGIYINFNEENILQAKALIIGPQDTIYENAYLFFTIVFPKNYPYSPPIITYKSQNKIRIHPNIYVNGKVCLSILGTWSGPGWTSAMDITNVLLTIQSLLDNNPLSNEPGYEKPLSESILHTNYNKIIKYNTIDNLILDNLCNYYEEFDIFKSIMIEHFKKYKDKIYSNIIKCENIKEQVKIGIYHINILIDYNQLKNKWEKVMNENIINI